MGFFTVAGRLFVLDYHSKSTAVCGTALVLDIEIGTLGGF